MLQYLYSRLQCVLQVALMLTDDPNEDLDDLEPEVRPRFQHEWEAQQQGAPEAAAEAAAPKRARGKASRGGKWQVRPRPLPPCSPPWLTQSHVVSGGCDFGIFVISTTDAGQWTRQTCPALMLPHFCFALSQSYFQKRCCPASHDPSQCQSCVVS